MSTIAKTPGSNKKQNKNSSTLLKNNKIYDDQSLDYTINKNPFYIILFFIISLLLM